MYDVIVISRYISLKLNIYSREVTYIWISSPCV